MANVEVHVAPQRPEPCESCGRPLLRVTITRDGAEHRVPWEVYAVREHTPPWCRAARGLP